MTMTPRLRKFVLTAHVTTTVGWLGAVVAFLALGIAGLTSQDAQMVRGAYLAMGPIGWLVILPLALASLLIGAVQSLGTPWGLFRHYWVLFKLVLTALSVGVLLLHMSTISLLSDAAAQTTLASTDLRGARVQITVAAGAGLLVLLVINALSVYKPRGMTRYGQRKQHEQRRKQREQLPAPVP